MDDTNMLDRAEALEETQENSRLNLDTDVLKGRKETHLSLGDLYGIEIFTDEILEREAQLKAEELADFERLGKRVFIKTFASETEDLSLQELLFTKKTDAIKKAEYASLKNDYSNYYYAGAMAIVILFAFSLIKYNQYRKRKREEYVNYLNLENPGR